MTDLIILLAHTSLLPIEMKKSILSGSVPPLSEIVANLLYTAQDCDALTFSDPNSTIIEKRIARQCLIVAFLSAIACTIEPKIVDTNTLAK